MLITDQVATAPCTDLSQARSPLYILHARFIYSGG
jgi:hypothetical protein